MSKLAIAIAAIALAGTPAFAADMARKTPLKAPPSVIAPVNNWTGPYVGLNAGGAWGDNQESLLLTGRWPGNAEVPALQAAGSQSTHMSGFTGGGQIGYNVQIRSVVFGIEADIDYLRLRADEAIANVVNPSNNVYAFAASAGTDWLATIRGRVGVAFDRLLLYATGGLAITDQKFSQSIIQGAGSNFVETGSVSTTKSRAAVGGGIEYALGSGWSVKGEYLYINLGQVSFSSAGSPGAGNAGYTGQHSDSMHIDIARAGINYKFGN